MAQKVEVVLQPLYAPQAGRTGAVCSVLKIDDATFLLDCGWDERMGSEALEPLKKCVPTLLAYRCGFIGRGRRAVLCLSLGKLATLRLPSRRPGLTPRFQPCAPQPPPPLLSAAGYARQSMLCLFRTATWSTAAHCRSWLPR